MFAVFNTFWAGPGVGNNLDALTLCNISDYVKSLEEGSIWHRVCLQNQWDHVGLHKSR